MAQVPAGESGEKTEDTKEEKKAEKKEAATRQYLITADRTIDLGDENALAALREEFGNDEGGGEIDVMVRIGRAVQSSPQKAISALADAKDINGVTSAFSENSVTTVKVKTETKRVVDFES